MSLLVSRLVGCLYGGGDDFAVCHPRFVGRRCVERAGRYAAVQSAFTAALLQPLRWAAPAGRLAGDDGLSVEAGALSSLRRALGAAGGAGRVSDGGGLCFPLQPLWPDRVPAVGQRLYGDSDSRHRH
jgi:hypothetical protein